MLAQGPTPIKFADPVNQMAQLMQLKNAQQTGVVNQMAIDKGNRQQADQAAYRNMLAQPGFNSTDSATQAQMYALGHGADAVNMAASAEAQQKASLASDARGIARFKANFPPLGTPDEIRAYHKLAVSSDPEYAHAIAQHPGGLEGANAHLEQLLGSPEGIQHLRDTMSGESQVTRDAHALAVARTTEANARAAKAGRPDAAVKPPAINKITIRDPKNPDRSLIVNANIQPDEPNYVLGEAPESPSALATRTKKSDAAETKRVAQSQVDSLLDSLSQDANNLYKQGGIPSIKDPAMSNIGKWVKNTTVGLGISKAIGTEAQSTLERMKSTKLQLLNAIKAATGMSSKTLDSNQELKIWLDSLGTTGGTLESLNGIIKNLRSYGEGAGTTPPPDGSGDQRSQALEWAKSNPNDPRAAVILQKLGVQ